MVPRHVNLALVQAERPAVEAWADRNEWEVEFAPESGLLKASVKHPIDGQPVWLTADLVGYRALPPAWRCVNREGVEVKSAYPAPGPLPDGKASIFHSKPVICAPFNRLAYKDGEGPHANDWGEAVRWSRIAGDFATPKTLADMLMVIATHLAFSPGRQ
jgi:hypothetical protein